MDEVVPTEFDDICAWNCECGKVFTKMWLADTHQANTDHIMERIILDREAFDKL